MPAVYADVSYVAVTWLPVCFVDLGLDTALDLKNSIACTAMAHESHTFF